MSYTRNAEGFIRSASRKLREEGGFSLVELMVVILMMTFIMIVLYTSTDSFIRINDVTQGRSFSLASARTALERASKEIRAANPIKLQTPTTNYATRVTFDVYCSQAGVGNCDAQNLRPVTFELRDLGGTAHSASGNALVQTTGGVTGTVIVGPDGPAAVPVGQRRGAVVNGSSRPVFRYYDRTGAIISTAAAETFRDCTRRVEILLVVVSEHRRPNSTIQLTTDVDLRNFQRISTC